MSARRWGLIAAAMFASLAACEWQEGRGDQDTAPAEERAIRGADAAPGASLVPPAGKGSPIFFTQETLEPRDDLGVDEDVEAGIEDDENAGVEGAHEIEEEPELGTGTDELDEDVGEDEGPGADITEGVDEHEGVGGTEPLDLEDDAP